MTRSQTSEVAFLDLFDPAFQPHSAAIHAAREVNWYARTSLGYAMLRYEDVVALLSDRRLRQGAAALMPLQGVTEGPLADWWRLIILNIEGDEHTRLRRLVGKAFTPRRIEELRPLMRTVVRELVDP